MKIEQLLAQHFYNSKKVTLQGMGTFMLSPDFVMPKDTDKDAEIPDNAISFTYNQRATEDDALIDYIVQQTRKMKSLASADLDSYLILGKQFLNIGKPFIIEGIGMLAKNQQGELEFIKGNTFHTKMETATAALKEKAEDAEISFSSDIKPPSGGKKGLLIALLITGLGLAGTTAWYFLIRKNNTNITTRTVTPVINTDTTKTTETKPDTTAVIPAAPPVAAADGYTFKVVFMITADSNRAVYRMNELTNRGHKVIMYKQDSVRYRLAEPFTLPLSDTTRIKDSLNNFYFLGKGFIELK